MMALYAVQEQSSKTQIRPASRRRQDLERDVRGMESSNRTQETSRTSRAKEVYAKDNTNDTQETKGVTNS
jgi:hypothetical protein